MDAVAERSRRPVATDSSDEWFGRILIILYCLASVLVGVAAFLAAWLYAITQYGFFLGVGLGIFPSAVIGILAGVFWPVAAFVIWKWPEFVAKIMGST